MRDLNLLKVFEAIMSTGSVNEAAKKLSISAPAVSQSLGKLRTEYNDPLFIRDGRGLKPSSFALYLFDELEEPLSILMNSSDINSSFEPKTSKRIFRIASNSDLDVLFFSKLRKKISEVSPYIDIEMKAAERDEEKIQNLLRLRKVDLILATVPLNERSYINESFAKLKPCIICRTDHPRIGDTLSLEEFFKEEHCSWATDRNKTTLFHLASKRGIIDERKIIYASQSIFNIALIAKSSDALTICTVPHFDMIKDVGGIKKMNVPFEVDDADIFCCWHQSFNKDQGLIWLRGLIKEVLSE